MRLRTILLILGFLALFSVTAGGFLYYSSLRTSDVSKAEIQAAHHAEKIENLVSSYLKDNQKAVRALAGLKELQNALAGPAEISLAPANLILDHFSESLKVSVSYLMDRNGKTIASSNRQDPASFVGKNYSFRPYFKAAIDGHPAVYMALGVTSKKRGIYYSHPIYDSRSNGPIGVVVLKAGIGRIEKEFINLNNYSPQMLTFITGPHGVVFMSDHKEFLYRLLWPVADESLVEILNSKQFGEGPWEWSGFKRKSANRVVDRDGNEYLVFQKAIGSLPGWNVVHLHDISVLSKSIYAPFIGTTGYIIPALCVFIGLSVFILYNMGRSDIKRRVAAEKALREREAFIKAVLDNLPIGIAVNSVNPVVRFEYMNANFPKFYRTTREALTEPDAFWNAVYEEPEFREQIKKRVLEDCASGDPGRMYWADVPIVRKGEETTFITARNIPVPDKQLMISTVWDVTEGKLADLKLQESEQRFRELFDHMSSGVAIYESPDKGQSFVFKDLNKAGLAFGGKKKDAVVGREVREVFPGVEALGLFDVFKRVWRTGIPERHPGSMYEDDNLVLWVENYVCKLPSGELVAIYEDTTAQKQAEEAKEKLEKQMQRAQKMESIGALAGGIAHDFNNILFPIIGLSELLMEDLPAGSPERENVAEIFKAARRAGGLVKQILSFSRQADHQKLPVRIQPVLKEVVRLMRSTIPSNIEIIDHLQADCGLVMADPTQLHQVAMNIMTNAFHAVEQDGGRISLTLEEMELGGKDWPNSSLEPGKYATLTVADTGCGIDPAVMDKIFDPYFTTKPHGKGTGLGLAVVYGIVKNHGGDIRVYSEPGRGTTVNVYVPLLKKNAYTAVSERSAPYQTGTEKILLVDDEEAVVRLEKQMLERLGYRVTSRVSSVEALEAFKSNPDAFDLVITDMTMPNMTGDQLAQNLISIRSDIPVIICTGFSEKLTQKKAELMGIKGLLMKPIVKSEMAQMVRKVLDADQSEPSPVSFPFQ